MIDRLRDEQTISLKEAAGLSVFVRRPTYKKLWKWKRYGLRGVKLECFKEGRDLYTSVEAILRFLEKTQ